MTEKHHPTPMVVSPQLEPRKANRVCHSRPRRIPNRGDVPSSAVAELLGLSSKRSSRTLRAARNQSQNGGCKLAGKGLGAGRDESLTSDIWSTPRDAVLSADNT